MHLHREKDTAIIQGLKAEVASEESPEVGRAMAALRPVELDCWTVESFLPFLSLTLISFLEQNSRACKVPGLRFQLREQSRAHKRTWERTAHSTADTHAPNHTTSHSCILSHIPHKHNHTHLPSQGHTLLTHSCMHNTRSHTHTHTRTLPTIIVMSSRRPHPLRKPQALVVSVTAVAAPSHGTKCETEGEGKSHGSFCSRSGSVWSQTPAPAPSSACPQVTVREV